MHVNYPDNQRSRSSREIPKICGCTPHYCGHARGNEECSRGPICGRDKSFSGSEGTHPKQIRYIIGNEGCERFSFYGIRNILTVFLVSFLLLYLPESEAARGAKDVFHTFVIGVYFFPLQSVTFGCLCKCGRAKLRSHETCWLNGLWCDCVSNVLLRLVAFVAALAFGLVARTYPLVDHYRRQPNS